MDNITIIKSAKVAVYKGDVYKAVKGYCIHCDLYNECGDNKATIHACEDAIGAGMLFKKADNKAYEHALETARMQGEIDGLKERVAELEADNAGLNGLEVDEVEPLPCPFCGNAPRIDCTGGDWDVSCVEDRDVCPNVARTTPYDTRKAAIAAWNHRR